MPAYNESSHIQGILNKVCNVVLPFGMAMELVVVNDGSKDETAERIQQFVDAHPERDIRIVHHERNQGKGAAIRTGLAFVTGDYTVIQDGDEELDPNDFVAMVTKMETESLDVLYGSRFLLNRNAFYSTFLLGNHVLAWTVNLLYRQKSTDEATCDKMFRTELLKSIPRECNGFEFCPEVTAKVARRGYKIVEVPIHYYPRSFEQGKKIRARDGWKAIKTLFKYRF